MGRHDLEYPKDATNLVKRHGERGIYALRKIHELVNSTPLIHLSFNPSNSQFPVTLPMIGQMGSFDRPSADLGDPLELYVHGYVSGRMFNTASASTDGVPVCVAASHVDGLVLSLSSFNSSYNYRSAVLFGHAYLVKDPAEKLFGLELLTNSVVAGRWENSRLPPTNAELQSTSVLKIKIASGSLKIRDGGGSDDKHDMENEATLNSIWTGVIPVYQVASEPVPSAYNKVDVPSYITDFTECFSNDNKEYATNAMKK